jgi:hypothetical protein
LKILGIARQFEIGFSSNAKPTVLRRLHQNTAKTLNHSQYHSFSLLAAKAPPLSTNTTYERLLRGINTSAHHINTTRQHTCIHHTSSTHQHTNTPTHQHINTWKHPQITVIIKTSRQQSAHSTPSTHQHTMSQHTHPITKATYHINTSLFHQTQSK